MSEASRPESTRIGHDADDCLVYVALLLSAHSRDCGPRLIYMSPASPIASDRGRVAHTLSSPALVYSVCERGIYSRGVVHLDANCHPDRARPDNVVARNQGLTRHWGVF